MTLQRMLWFTPLAFFFAWLRPDLSEFLMVITQLAATIIFYLPFYVLLKNIKAPVPEKFAPLIPAFSIAAAGLYSILILHFAIPVTAAWGFIFLAAVISVLRAPEKKNISFQQIITLEWFEAVFWILLIFNLFSYNQVSPFFSPWSCDESLAHLSIPKIYSENSRWLNTWWVRGSFLPQLMHGQYAMQMTLMKAIGFRADLISQLTNIILLFSTVLSSRTILTKKSSYLFGVTLLSLSLTRLNLAQVYMDLPSAMFLTALAGVLVFSFSEASFLNGMIVGILTASALGVKHQTLLFSTPMLIGWLVARWVTFKGQHQRRDEVKYVIGATSAFIPIFCVLFFHNWILTGNPLFPFLFGRDGTAFHWDAETLKGYAGAISYWLKDRHPWAMVKSFFSIVREVNPYVDAGGFHLSFLFFGSGALMGMIAGKNKPLRLLAVFFLTLFAVQYAAWYYTSPVLRYLYPTACLMVLATLYLLQNSKTKCLQYLASAGLIAVFVHCQTLWLTKLPTSIPITLADTQRFYSKFLMSFAAYEWLDINTPRDSLIYTYGGSCEWLQSPRAFFGDWFGDTSFSTFNTGRPEDVRSFIQRNQPDYILQLQETNLRKIDTLNAREICIEEVSSFVDKNIKIFKVLKIKGCEPIGESAIRATIPYQVKGFDFFFRK